MHPTGQVEDNDVPYATVVIPAYNEAEYIGRCLAALAGSDYPVDRFEVIVVDNGSTDDTAAIVQDSGAKLLSFPEGNVGAVRNHAARQSSAEYLAFIDADCIASTGWLRTAVTYLQAHRDYGAIGGACRAEASSTWIEKAWDSGRSTVAIDVKNLATGSMIVPRSLFVELGGFDENLTAGEDYDISARIRQRNLKLYSHPGCSVTHLGWPKSLKDVFKRQLWHGLSQIEASHGVWNRTVMSVHVFLASLIAAVALIFVSPTVYSPAIVFMLAALLIPFVASLSRCRNLIPTSTRLWRAVILYPIFCSYYLGRSAGLICNYGRLASRALKRPK